MKKYFFIILAFMCFGTLNAQTVDWSQFPNPVDSIQKKIYEPAQYLIHYTYKFARDAKYPREKYIGLSLLQIGDKYNRFMDYNSLRVDSLEDEAYRQQLSAAQVGPTILNLLRKVHLEDDILIDKQKNREIIQCTAGGIQEYQYKEDCPALKWTLVEGDTVIADYHCKKATTSLFGRDYIAWYSTDVNLPYGPYKFNGLPGLIFKVSDTQKNFIFTLCGLKKATSYSPIYLHKEDIIQTSRKDVRKIYKNYCDSPGVALVSDGSVQVSKEDLAKVKAFPYNPIELE